MNLAKFETGSLLEAAPVQERCSSKSTETAVVKVPAKRHASPDVTDFHPYSASPLLPHKSATLDPYDHPALRSPSPAWSTLAKISKKRTSNATFDRQSSIPKLGDRFRLPMRLFPENLPPAHSSPPRSRFAPTKVTLFTPSQPTELHEVSRTKPHFNVLTVKGSQYGPLVQARQNEQSRRSEPTSGLTHAEQEATSKSIPLRRRHVPHQARQKQECETDWLQAWRIPSDQHRYEYEGSIGAPHKSGFASEGLTPFGRFNQAG